MSGNNTPTLDTQWEYMESAKISDGPIYGILNALSVYADSTGMQVKVRSGRGVVQGKWFNSDAEEALVIAANGSGNARIDRVVLQLDRTGDKEVNLAVLTGTPAASPVAPVLTQTASGIYEVSLAAIAVANGAVTIAAGNVTDERIFASSRAAPGGVVEIEATELAGADVTITAGAFTDVTGLTETKVIEGTGSVVLVIATVSVQNDTTMTIAGRIDVGLRVDSGATVGAAFGSGIPQAITVCGVFTGLSAGSHDFKVRVFDGAASGTVRVRVARSSITVVEFKS